MLPVAQITTWGFLTDSRTALVVHLMYETAVYKSSTLTSTYITHYRHSIVVVGVAMSILNIFGLQTKYPTLKFVVCSLYSFICYRRSLLHSFICYRDCFTTCFLMSVIVAC
jgi:hypothetical protein